MPDPDSRTNVEDRYGVDAEATGMTPVWRIVQKVHAEMPLIPKSQRAPSDMGGFAFRGIDDIEAKLKPLLAEHDLFYVPIVVGFERDDTGRTAGGKVNQRVTVHVVLRFYGPGGDTLDMDGWGEATDTGDKATPKATTNATKNILTAWLQLHARDDDTDAHSTEDEVEDPYASPLQYERVKSAVAELPEDERAKAAGEGLVLGVKVSEVIDGKRMIVMRESQVQPLLDRLANLKTEAEASDAPFAGASDELREADATLAEADAKAEGAGVPLEKYGYELWSHKDLDLTLEPKGLPTTGTIAEKAARLRAWDAANQPDGYTEPEEAPY
jgi:hypothetical protein